MPWTWPRMLRSHTMRCGVVLQHAIPCHLATLPPCHLAIMSTSVEDLRSSIATIHFIPTLWQSRRHFDAAYAAGRGTWRSVQLASSRALLAHSPLRPKTTQGTMQHQIAARRCEPQTYCDAGCRMHTEPSLNFSLIASGTAYRKKASRKPGQRAFSRR